MKEKRTKKKKFNSIFLKIALLCGFAVAVFYVISIAKHPVKTEIIRYGKLEDKVSTSGFLIRNELPLIASDSGVLSCNVKEGERVKKGTKIASIFSGKVDETLQSKIIGVNERLAELERSEIQKDLIAGDEVQVNNVISSSVYSVILDTYSKNTGKITVYKDKINKLLEKKSVSDGQAPKGTTTIDMLKAQKSELEKSVGTKKIDVFAPISGVFSSNIDGYEDFFNLKDPKTITPKVLENADKQKEMPKKIAKAGQAAVKILNNYEWYYAASVDFKWIKELKKDDDVSLRFNDISDLELSGVVHSVSGEENGKVVLIIACDKYVPDIYELRRANADIIRNSYRGFKVPKSAVRVADDGANGVYVLKDGISKFKAIDIMHQTEDYVIVKEDNKSKNSLLLYDEVVVSGGEA